MPRQKKSLKYFETRDYIRCILKFLISPIYFYVECVTSYTRTFIFNTNMIFWHSFLVFFISHPFLFYESQDEQRKSEVFSFTICFFLICFLILMISVSFLLRSIQSLIHVQLGLFGMVLSVHSQIFCIFAERREGFDLNIIRIIDAVAVHAYVFFYLLFCNLGTRLYVRLPVKMMPFSFGVKLYVKVIAVLHLIYAIILLIGLESQNQRYHLKLLISSFKIFCSFFISVDAFSMIFTDQFLICKHRERKEDFETKKPIGGTICHVAIRRAFNKRKDFGDLPADFQYDDDIKLHPKWYTKYQPCVEFV
ncbi:hypothetical protein CRE_17845 [Caenorhabditis remanei]|uniref:Uncharacterized protein n=1 Tax=Caenorhabditis remanei TaxID=31234 RepID=E3MDM5_CAERE|nr:hypothetical protein CRE_17845 [Caenorhabditis remanei]